MEMMNETELAKFMAKVVVDEATGCLLWTGKIDKNGYARFYWSKRSWTAHHVAYLHFVGAIPKGLEPDHLCRVRHCVNWRHLEAVTHKENVHRGNPYWRQLTSRTHCANGHEFTPANTAGRNGSRARRCRTCARERMRRIRSGGG